MRCARLLKILLTYPCPLDDASVMNSRCLYCDKRLSLFHGKKKPFCSDAHEDLYLERQA